MTNVCISRENIVDVDTDVHQVASKRKEERLFRTLLS